MSPQKNGALLTYTQFILIILSIAAFVYTIKLIRKDSILKESKCDEL